MGIDAYNPSQINGLGSATSHTSKVVVISPSSLAGVDVDYTFYQIGIGEEIVDDKGTCGNLMAAVGPFVIDEGLVQVDPAAAHAVISVFNTNIQKVIKTKVPVINGKAKVSGEYLMSGVVNPGAKISVHILSPGGGKTGRTLPLDTVYSVDTAIRKYDVSFVDVVNPFIFVSSHSFGLRGTESVSELSANNSFLEELDIIRNKMTVAVGMADNEEQAKAESPAVPKIGIVAEPQDYITTSGKHIKKDEVDIIAKMISMGRVHRTFAGSGLYCLAAAAMLNGTIPNQFINNRSKEQTIRVGHADGIVEIEVALSEEGNDIAHVGLARTARRIMKGELFIPY